MLAVTGANGNLGRSLLAALAEAPARGTAPVRALVRSAPAAASLRELEARGAAEVRVVDYRDSGAMTDALTGCSQVVHLVGIIRETAGNRYADAHEGTAQALATAVAAAGIDRLVGVSILGADLASGNACLRSRAAADAILLGAAPHVLVLRVPMVLGRDDHAARALRARTARDWSVTLRASSLEQPIDADDVLAAIRAGLAGRVSGRAVLDLAGPESLSRRNLTLRAAAVLGRRTRVLSLPLVLGLGAAWLMERFTAYPPVTRAMLGVLDHDDRIDPGPAARQLGITLTSLDSTLAKVVGRSN